MLTIFFSPPCEFLCCYTKRKKKKKKTNRQKRDKNIKYLSEKFFLSYLEDALGEGGLLRELLQVFGIRVVIGGEVGLEHAQLVVLERRPQSLGLLLLLGRDLLLLLLVAVDAVGASHRAHQHGGTRRRRRRVHQPATVDAHVRIVLPLVHQADLHVGRRLDARHPPLGAHPLVLERRGRRAGSRRALVVVEFVGFHHGNIDQARRMGHLAVVMLLVEGVMLERMRTAERLLTMAHVSLNRWLL